MNNHGRVGGCLIAVIGFIVALVLVGAVLAVLVLSAGGGMPSLDEFADRSSQSASYADGNGTLGDKIKIELESGGASKVTVILNNADISALATEAVESDQDAPVRDIIMLCNADSTIDMTATVNDLSVYADDPGVPKIAKSILSSADGKQLYATVYLDYLGSGDFDVSITDVKIGKIGVPFSELIFASLSDELESGIESRVSSFTGFNLLDFKVEQDRVVLTGSMSR